MYWDWSSAEKTEEERGLRFNNQYGDNHKSKLLLEIKYKKSLSDWYSISERLFLPFSAKNVHFLQG